MSKGITEFKYNEESPFDYVLNKPHVFSEGLAAVQFNNKYGFIDRDGNEVIPFKFFMTHGFQDGFAFVGNSLGGFINRDGDEVVPLRYWEAKRFAHGLAPVKLDKKWGAVNTDGEEVIPVQLDYLGIFRNCSSPFERIKE